MLIECHVSDRFNITERRVTDEGYLIAPGLIAASDNIQPYLARELGIKDGDPNRIVRLYRPKEEVERSASTFDGKPITLNHPTSGMVNAANWRTVTRGEARDTKPVANGLRAELIVRDKQAVDAIQGGKTELSCGYDFSLNLTPGTTANGAAYDGVMTNIRGNHIAIVDVARGGHALRIADSDPRQGDRPMAMRRIVFDALVLGTTAAFTMELEEPHATTVEDGIKGILAARDAALEEAAGKVAAAEKAVTEAQKQLKDVTDAMPAKIQAAAQDKADVIAAAAKLGIELKDVPAKDAQTLRREVLEGATKNAGHKKVIDAMLPDVAKAGETEAKLTLTAVLTAVDALPPKRTPAHDGLGKALAGRVTDKKTGEGDDSACGRDEFLAASANAYKSKK